MKETIVTTYTFSIKPEVKEVAGTVGGIVCGVAITFVLVLFILDITRWIWGKPNG